jgi:DNA mismatch endonuclease, patch repair protein
VNRAPTITAKVSRGAKKANLPTTAMRSALMARVRQSGTTPELAVREVLRKLGVRARANAVRLPGSPDLYDPTRKLAVFVHGCFWHRHSGCEACTTPTNNADYWTQKFKENIARDRRKSSQLRRLGYRVITIWECQVKSATKAAQLERKLGRFFGVL